MGSERDFRLTVTSGSRAPILSREIKDIYERDLKCGTVRGGLAAVDIAGSVHRRRAPRGARTGADSRRRIRELSRPSRVPRTSPQLARRGAKPLIQQFDSQ